MWYKVLTYDLQSAHGGRFDWTPYVNNPEKRTPVIPNPTLCYCGYHGAPDPMKFPVKGMRVFELIVDGPPTEQADTKGTWPTVGLGCERPELVPDWWHDVETFVDSLSQIPWLQPQGQPDPAWQTFDTMDDAKDAAWIATREIDQDLTWIMGRGTVYNAMFHLTWEAVHHAVFNAGRRTVWDVAREAAWDAMGEIHKNTEESAREAFSDATQDACLYAQRLTCGTDLWLGQRHIDHPVARMEVWRRGYGLLCSVKGVLYVYRRVGDG